MQAVTPSLPGGILSLDGDMCAFAIQTSFGGRKEPRPCRSPQQQPHVRRMCRRIRGKGGLRMQLEEPDGKRKSIVSAPSPKQKESGKDDVHRGGEVEGTEGEDLQRTDEVRGREQLEEASLSRLFSTISLDKDVGERYQPRSLVGAAALVAGTTVGAGVLALPAVTQEGGFLPATLFLFGSWVFMAATGNLIADVTVGTMWTTGRRQVSLLSMAETTLGKAGALAAGGAYVFIHYALLVAYISQGGKVFGDYLEEFLTAWNSSLATSLLTPWTPPILFASGLGALMFLGGEKTVERVNNTLVLGLIASFGLLVATVAPSVNMENFLHSQPREALKAIPVMILSLVFHNVIPVISSQLDGDLKRIRTAINVGSFVPLSMFVIWNAVILGIAPQDATAFDPLEAIRSGDASAAHIVSAFSLIAISTSFFGFVYGLIDFLKDARHQLRISTATKELDAFREKRDSVMTNVMDSDLPLYATTLVPPTILALIAPNIFFKALDTAGTYGISVLFGIIPAAMVWKMRFGSDGASKLETPFQPNVPGGRWMLITIAGLATSLIASELVEVLLPWFH